MAMVELHVGCLTCFKSLGLNFLNIQSAENCLVKEALRKHFWFEETDFQLATICPSCWEQVESFNRFYISVEQRYQSQISDGINVKSELEADELLSVQEVLPECSSFNADFETEQLDKLSSFNADESLEEKEGSSERSEDKELEDNEDSSKNDKAVDFSPGWKIRNARLQDECIRKHVKYNCEQCGEESESFRTFKMHALLCHDIKSPFLECCGVKYSQRFALFKHVQFLTNPEMFRCQECRKNFVDRRGYLNHMDRVHASGIEDRIFKCDRCPKSFAIQYNLWLHMKNHVGWKCEECGRILGNSKSLCDHVRRVHPDLPSFSCEFCSKVFRIKSSWLRHKKLHEKQQCPLCQQMIPKGKSMQKHAREMHPLSVVCKICDQRLRSRAALISHKVTAHGVKEPNHHQMDPCAGVDQNSANCDPGELDVENLQLHKDLRVVLHDCMEEGLPEGTGISTDIETEQLESSIVVKEELIIEEPVQQDYSGCEVSQSYEDTGQGAQNDDESTQLQQKSPSREIADQNSPMRDEFITKHVKYTCAKCGLESKTFNQFRTHARKVHDDRSAFIKCCGLKFRRRYLLFDHVQSLSNPATYRCEECQTNFVFRERFQRHMINVHKIQKFRCDWCSKSYNSKQLLRSHMRGHLDEDNNQCPLNEKFEASQSDEDTGQDDQSDSELTQLRQKSRSSETADQNRSTSDAFITKHVKYTCAKCGQESETFQMFRTHARLVHDDRSAFVECCGSKYYKRYLLHAHVLKLSNPNLYRCEECQRSFGLKERYVRHMREVHINQKLKCDWCLKSYSNKQLLRSHMRCHLGNKCPHCEESLPDVKSLRVHVREQHPEVEIDVTKSASLTESLPRYSGHNSEDQLEDSESSIVVKEERVIVDPSDEVVNHNDNKSGSEHSDAEMQQDDQELVVVDRTSETSNDTATRNDDPDQFIRKHVKYSCAKCEKESLTFRSFMDHAQYVHGDQFAAVECCGKKYRRRNLLTAHVQTALNPNLFSCTICQVTFTRKRNYQHHLENIHENKSFKCDRCPKRYGSQRRLREHKMTHLTGSDYRKCPHCEKLYNRRRSLEAHLKHEHRDTPKFTCQVCSLEYGIESWLRQHELKHKKIKCLLCTQQFLGPKILRAHVLRVHPDANIPVICPICRDVLPTAVALEAHKARAHVQQFPDDDEELAGGSNNTSDAETDYLENSVVVKDQQDIDEQEIEDKSESECLEDEMEQGSSELVVVAGKSRMPGKQIKRSVPDDYIKEHVKFICEKCGEESATFKLFMDHALEVHGDKSAYVECCGRRFRRKFLLFDHVQTVKNPNAYRCEICKHSFSLMGNYKRHMKIVHKILYECPHCEKTLPDEKCLLAHVLEMHADADPPVVCTICRKVVLSKHALEAHNALEHDDQNTLQEDNDIPVESQSEWSKEKKEFELYQNQLVSLIVKSETKVGESDSLEGKTSGCSSDNSLVIGQSTPIVNDSDSEQSSNDEEVQDNPNKRTKSKPLEEQFNDDALSVKNRVREQT